MVRLLVQVLFNGEKSSSYQSGITGQLRGYKFHLLDTERLRPFAGFFVDIIYEDTGRAEYTSTPDYLLRIQQEQEGREAPRGEGRIPRRLYRDMDQARLGGVCSGVAKYFGTSPTWIRLLMFLPLILLLLLGWIPFFWWLVPLMSNLLGVFFICYLIMWFAVPAARTARQKLEQNGQRITVQSIEEASAANHDVDADAKPVVAKAFMPWGRSS